MTRFLVLSLFLLTGCVRTLHGVAGTPPGYPSGRVAIHLTSASPRVLVTIDDRLVELPRKRTNRIIVDQVMPGVHVVRVAGGNSQTDRHENVFEVEVYAGQTTDVVMDGPKMSMASATYWGMFLQSYFAFLLLL